MFGVALTSIKADEVCQTFAGGSGKSIYSNT